MKKSLLLTMLLAFALPWTALANELTLSDGTTENSNVPVYGLYVDEFIHTQIIYPASSLTEMTGEEIHSMRFYLKSPASDSWGNAHFEIRLSEVSAASFSSAAWNTENAGVLVYSGALDGTGEEMNVVFTTSFTYNGGNLLFDLVNTTKGTYKSASFYGVSTTGASVSGNNSSDVTKATASLRNFLPKTTFDYGAPPTCIKPTGLAVSLTPGDGSVATLSWTAGADEAAWQICLNDDEDNLVEAGSNPFELTGLTPEQAYTAKVRANCDEEQSAWSNEVSFTPSNAYSITLNEGTNTNSYVPFYGYYADMGAHSQFIIPASELLSLQWASLEQMTFYSSTASVTWGNAVYDVCLKEVENTSFTSSALESWDNMNVVYQGSLSVSGGKMVIIFTTPFTYKGGNLMIGFNETTNGDDTSLSWLGLSQTDYTAVYKYGSSSSGRAQFLPKLTIEYVPGEAPSCLPVSGLSASEIGSHSAILDWTEGGSESAWKLYYKKASEADFGEAINIDSKPYTLDNLDAATTYQFKVVAVCSDSDESDASAAASFTTECEALTIDADHPYSENFDGLTAGDNVLPICWNYINTTTYSYQVNPRTYADGYYSTAHSSPNCLYFYSAYSSSSSYDPRPQYAILPEMDNLNALRIKLYARAYNTGNSYDATFKVGVMSDPEDAGTFEEIQSITPTSTSYEQYVVALSDASLLQGHIAIMIEAADNKIGTSTYSYRSVYIDDIVVEPIPDCLEPAGLAIAEDDGAISTNSVLLQISEGESGESAWKLQYKKSADEEWITLSDAVTENPFELAGLEAASAYDIRIAAWCDPSNAEAVSGYLDPISVATACEDIISFPWGEDFNSLTAGIPVCWDNAEGTTTNESYKWNYYASGRDGAGLRFNSYNNDNGLTNFLKTPVLSLPSDKAMLLTFMYKNSAGGDFSVLISTDGGVTYEETPLASGLTSQSSWAEKECDLSAYAGQNVVIAFKGTSNYGYGDAYIYLDDVKVDEAPTCVKPTALNAVANGLNATFSWTSDAGNFSVAHATDATANPDDNIVAASVSDESYEMNNLALGDHYFWVRANCDGSNGSSDWVGPVSVHIGYCVPAPTSVDGSGISNVTFGTGAVLVNNDTHPTSKPFYGDYTAQIGAVQAGVEASIAITYATGYTYNTYVWVDLNNNLSFEPEEVVTYGESTDANPTTLTLNFTIPATQATGNYRMRIGGADSGLGSTPANANPCYTGTYGIFEDYTLLVLEAPSCLPPTALSAEVNGFGATITWASDADKFNLQYKKTAEAETAWVAVGNIEATSYAIGNLDGGTEYEVQIQANCGSSNSEWSSSVTFTTALCAAEDQCVLTFELTDSYGDSWNGNAIRVTDVLSGKVLGEMANENLNETTGSGENEVNIKTLSVCNGREIQFSWVTGSYPTETSWVVKDVNGQVLFSGAGTSSMETGEILYTHTVDCTHKFYLEIGTSGYATFYDADYAYTMPAKLSGHTFNATTGLSDAIYEANQIIPAKEPLVMKAADDVVLPETFVLVEAETDALPSAGNDLIGVNNEMTIVNHADTLYYVLSLNAANEVESVGFYWMNETGAGDFTMPAHKAYLTVYSPGAGAEAAPRFYLFHGENNATWLENLQGVDGTVKFFHNGHFYIMRDHVIYDATGKRVELKYN